MNWIGEFCPLQSFVEFFISNATIFLDFSDFESFPNRKDCGNPNSILEQPEAFYRIVKTVIAEFVIFGFVENEGNGFGFNVEYHVRRFGSNSSFGSGYERNESGGFN